MTLVEWYVARAGGILSFTLLTLTVVAGLTLSGRARLRYWPRFAVEDVHRFLGTPTGVFLAVHVGTLYLDTFVPFSLGQIVVPGLASYRPFATALGILAAELLVALALTNRYRRRLSYGFWRRVHYLNFAVWIGAFAHGVLAGTDSNAQWAIALYTASAAAVGGLLTWRVLTLAPAAATR
jgi:predicted ferric reductase